MIKNEKQLQVTKNRLNEFKQAFESLREQNDVDPILKEIQLDALNSQISDFMTEIEEYDQLKSGVINSLFIDSFQQIPEILIKGRIAKGWSQADLAEKLHMKEQQIQRYESCNYATANSIRINQVLNILEIGVEPFKVDIGQPEFSIPKDIDIETVHLRLKNRGLLIAI